MFEQLINETATRFNLSAGSVSALVGELLSMITNERTGGAEGFVDQFRRAGLGDVVTSWFGGKEGRTISPAHIESALGATALDKLAGSSGLTRGVVTSALSFLVAESDRPVDAQRRVRLRRRAPLPGVPVCCRTGDLDRQARGPLRGSAALARVGCGGCAGDRRVPLAAAGCRHDRSAAHGQQPRRQDHLLRRRPRRVHPERDRQRAAHDVRRRKRRGHAARRSQRAAGRVAPASQRARRGFENAGVEFNVNGNNVSLGGWLSAADRQALSDKLLGIFGPQATVGSLGDAALMPFVPPTTRRSRLSAPSVRRECLRTRSCEP